MGLEGGGRGFKNKTVGSFRGDVDFDVLFYEHGGNNAKHPGLGDSLYISSGNCLRKGVKYRI